MASSVSSSSSSAAGGNDPFVLIERGNAMEKSGNLWSAADAFGQSSVLLRSEASKVMEEINQIEASTSSKGGEMSASMKRKSVTERAALRNKKLGEKRKIAALYLNESRLYLHRARNCLLQALTFETQEDERRSKEAQQADANVGPVGRRLKVLMERAEPLVGMLPPSEARRRRRIFGRIYAGGDVVEEEAEPGMKQEQADEKATAEEKKEDAAADANDEDAEMEAALLEEMDAEFGSQIPEAPGAGKTEDSSVAKADADELDIPAAPSLPTIPKKGDDDLVIPAAPENGAGHIEKKGSASSTSPPHSPSLGPLPPAAPTGQGAAGDPNSLEARLAQFDSSLPPQMKSQDERVADIHKGLGRLGLSLPDNNAKSIGKAFLNHTEKSEEEQVKDIMEQAADEARMEGGSVDPATLTAASAAGGIDGDAGSDDLVINDSDDLNAVLSKAGLTTSELKAEVSKIEDVLGEDGKRALRDLKDNGEVVADRAKALSLIGAAQELLFEASAYLEDDEDVDEEEQEIMAAGEDDDSGGEGAKKKESDSLRKGRAGLIGAQKCLEKALASLPK